MKDTGNTVMGMKLYVAEPGDNVPEGTVLIMNPEQAEVVAMRSERARLRGLLTRAREHVRCGTDCASDYSGVLGGPPCDCGKEALAAEIDSALAAKGTP